LREVAELLLAKDYATQEPRLGGVFIERPMLSISGGDSDALVELDKLARLLDSQWRLPGTSLTFGADAVAGLVPVVGDLATAVLSAYIVARAADVGAPKKSDGPHGRHVVLDTVVGSFPVIGSVFDVFYKANNRNIRLLRRHLEKRFHPTLSESEHESRA